MRIKENKICFVFTFEVITVLIGADRCGSVVCGGLRWFAVVCGGFCGADRCFGGALEVLCFAIRFGALQYVSELCETLSELWQCVSELCNCLLCDGNAMQSRNLLFVATVLWVSFLIFIFYDTNEQVIDFSNWCSLF